MSLWGSIDQADNAPKSTDAGGLGVSANGQAMFGNTQISAFATGLALGVFGVDKVEARLTSGDGKKIQHAGWNLRKQGTGSVISVIETVAGANYKSNGFITLTGGGGTGANASYVVNTSTNTITSITLVSAGSGYISAPTATAANATGANSSTIVAAVGGRAGRVQYETLVAMGSMTGDDEDVLFPDS